MVSRMAFGKREATGYGGIERREGERRATLRQRSTIRARIILPSGQIVRCSVQGHLQKRRHDLRSIDIGIAGPV